MEQTVLLAAKDPMTIEVVEASALAQGARVEVLSDSESLARRWPHAGLRLVAPEMASRVRWMPSTANTFVVGADASLLAEASAELGCPVLRLPGASTRLAELLVATGAPRSAGQTVAVVSASGGLGVSTIAAALALEGAKHDQRAALVDLAPHSGGIDLLLGAESLPGARWSDLGNASGQLGDLTDTLLKTHGVGVLAQCRQRPGAPTASAKQAVLASLARSHDIIVIDTAGEKVSADVTLLVAGADVRSVAAARMLCASDELVPTGLLVRTSTARRLAPKNVSEALGVPLLGVIRDDAAVPRLADMGHPPTSAVAKRFRHDIAHVWRAVHG